MDYYRQNSLLSSSKAPTLDMTNTNKGVQQTTGLIDNLIQRDRAKKQQEIENQYRQEQLLLQQAADRRAQENQIFNQDIAKQNLEINKATNTRNQDEHDYKVKSRYATDEAVNALRNKDLYTQKQITDEQRAIDNTVPDIASHYDRLLSKASTPEEINKITAEKNSAISEAQKAIDTELMSYNADVKSGDRANQIFNEVISAPNIDQTKFATAQKQLGDNLLAGIIGSNNFGKDLQKLQEENPNAVFDAKTISSILNNNLSRQLTGLNIKKTLKNMKDEEDYVAKYADADKLFMKNLNRKIQESYEGVMPDTPEYEAHFDKMAMLGKVLDSTNDPAVKQSLSGSSPKSILEAKDRRTAKTSYDSTLASTISKNTKEIKDIKKENLSIIKDLYPEKNFEKMQKNFDSVFKSVVDTVPTDYRAGVTELVKDVMLNYDVGPETIKAAIEKYSTDYVLWDSFNKDKFEKAIKSVSPDKALIKKSINKDRDDLLLTQLVENSRRVVNLENKNTLLNTPVEDQIDSIFKDVSKPVVKEEKVALNENTGVPKADQLDQTPKVDQVPKANQVPKDDDKIFNPEKKEFKFDDKTYVPDEKDDGYVIIPDSYKKNNNVLNTSQYNTRDAVDIINHNAEIFYSKIKDIKDSNLTDVEKKNKVEALYDKDYARTGVDQLKDGTNVAKAIAKFAVLTGKAAVAGANFAADTIPKIIDHTVEGIGNVADTIPKIIDHTIKGVDYAADTAAKGVNLTKDIALKGGEIVGDVSEDLFAKFLIEFIY
jgi:hypothetical protein